MRTLNDITGILAGKRTALRKQFPIKDMAVFGSYARNEQNEASDLDVMVEFAGPVGMEFIDLANELEKIIGIRVDLVSRQGIKPRYFEHIQKDLVYV